MNTTIAISTEVREQIKEFGNKGDTYETIITKLLNNAKQRQLQELLMDDSNCITVKEALNKAEKKWQK